ncbi:hypothetical protein ACFX15_009435 [Malus domestica]
MEFYQGYSGGQATVIGSVLVTNLKNRKKKRWLAQSRDCLYVIPDEVINSLIEEEITVNVAGGLMLQHPLIFPFVEAVILIGFTPLWDCLEKSQKTDSGSSLTIYCCGVVIGFLFET